MQNDETLNPEFIKGFNEGYILTQHLPDLSERLASFLGKSPRSIGFQAGREQLLHDQKENRSPAWLRKDRLSNLDKDQSRSKERDKDDRDRDE